MVGGVVAAVEPDSIARSLDIRPGDVLLEVNGHPLRDVLDVQFYAADEDLDLLIRRGDEDILYQTERGYGVPLGLEFAFPTFDGLRRCENRCDFCFVAQMPSGLRRSLYVRDDDYRYSLLCGNFVTLTNLTSEDWERLAEQRLSPLYVSVHATEPVLRRRLLGRDNIPDILTQIDRLAALRIELHTQIVLITGVNDGPHLMRTITDLVDRYPTVQSIGIVPVGLTRYHRGGCRLYTSVEARAMVDQIAPLQDRYRIRHGVSLVYLADEWYLLAGMGVPADEVYDDYPQIENGIGLVRQFLEDSCRLQVECCRLEVSSCTLVCGTLIAPVIRWAARDLAASSGTQMRVVPVVNRLFGESVTVSGLLSGEDVLAALQGRDLGDIVFLPAAMFSECPTENDVGVRGCPPRPAGENRVGLGHQYSSERTLDGLALEDLAGRLRRPVMMADSMSEVWKQIAICG